MLGMNMAARTCALGIATAVVCAGVVRADVTGTTQPIGAQAGSSQSAPAISGSGIVWTNLTGSNFDIYYQDVAGSAAPVNLTKTDGENEFLEDIDRGAVVWTHTGGGSNGDIILYDTATGARATVAASTPSVQFEHPAISGNYVVFERITSQFDIDVYDRTIGGSPGPQVTNDAAMQMHPRVSGDVIVYEDYGNDPNAPPAVYGYHISSNGPRFLIAAAPARWPDVDGDHVVYVGVDGAGHGQIYLYDLAAGTARALTSAASDKMTPRISGDRVVWTDDRNGDDDVYTYDLATGAEDLLAGGAGSQSTGDISGNRVVYNNRDAAGNETVFLFTFNDPPPSDLPVGCDPAKTDLVDGPTALSELSRRPVVGRGDFSSAAHRTYYVCVENGKPDGSAKSANVIVTVDGRVVLTPSDFQPRANPPTHVAAQLDLEQLRHWYWGWWRRHDASAHQWAASLFASPGSTISVSIRVAK